MDSTALLGVYRWHNAMLWGDSLLCAQLCKILTRTRFLLVGDIHRYRAGRHRTRQPGTHSTTKGRDDTELVHIQAINAEANRGRSRAQCLAKTVAILQTYQGTALGRCSAN